MSVEKGEYAAEWDEDILERGKTASFLTRYFKGLYGDPTTDSIYSSSFVLCLNADWGFGKTFLIKHWAEDLKNKLNHPVVYFDAWKNDFSDDPLLAFLSEFEQSLKSYETITPKGKKILNGVINVAKSAIAPTNLKSLSKVALKTFTGIDANEVVNELADIGAHVVDKYMTEALKSHNTRKTKIDEFSKKLEELLDELNTQGFSLPMYVFIDELDRCKPSYAIQLLEGIKHIFGTKGVYFIVATNKIQLSHSIQAVYGADFDSLTYLQRFFDQEYLLENPNYDSFSKMLAKKYRLSSINTEQLEMQYDFGYVFSILAKAFTLSLRAQEHVAKQLKAVALSHSHETVIHHWYLIFLTMLKIKNEDAFNSFFNDGFSEKLKSIFDVKITLQARKPVFSHDGSFQGITWGDINIMEILNWYRKYEKGNADRKLLPTESSEGRLVWSLERDGHFDKQSKNPLIIKNYKTLVLQAGGLS